MGVGVKWVKIFFMSIGCKNVLGVKLAYKYFMSQLGVKKISVSDRCKNTLGVK